MNKDIKTGRKILNGPMNGNPFRQLSLLRQGVEMNSNLLKVLFEITDNQDNSIYLQYKPFMDKLEEENNKILEILKKEYHDEFEVQE